MESGIAGINHVDQYIRFIEFFKSGLECLEQFIGQVPDKANGIGYYYLNVLWESKLAARWIQGCKKLVFGSYLTLGKCVEKCGFAGIGITNEINDRYLYFAAA